VDACKWVDEEVVKSYPPMVIKDMVST
jgi:hypothetical protein